MDLHRIWAKNPYKPQQVEAEIREFMEVLHDHKVKNMLEIGLFDGGTTYLFYNLIEPDGILISLDLEPHNRKMKFDNFIPNIRDIKFRIIIGDSHDDRVFNIVKDTLGLALLDVVFIDGDHSYEGVKRDYEMYSQLVRRDGIIAFHDIAHHKASLNCHVDKFYDEIKIKHQHLELIYDEKQGWGGIGILYKGAI